MDEDSALLQRYARDGSEAAFEELVRRRIGLVYGTALRRLRDPHRARDAAQSVFTDLARKSSALANHPVLVSWLYTSTHYAVNTLLRTERRQRARDLEAHFMNEINGSGDPEDWGNLRPLLDEELNRLGAKVRDAVLLRFYHGESFAGVGRALHLSEDAARKRVERGLEELRGRLARRGVTSTALLLSSLLAEQAAFAAPESLAAAVTRAALLKAAATAGVLGPLSFMTTSKAAVGVGAALLLMGLGSVAVETSQARRAAGDLVASEKQRQAAVTQAADLESKVARAEEARVAAAGAVGAKGAASVVPRRAGSSAAGGASGAAPATAKTRGNAFMAQHPEVRDALVAYFDASHLAQYGQLYAALNLPPDKVQAMQVLLRAGDSFGRVVQGGSIELSVADFPGGGYGGQQAAVQALLGDAGYQQFQACQQGLQDRMNAAALAGLLVDGDSPLTAVQAQQMVAVFGNASNQVYRSQYDWSAVYSSATGILSPAQLQMLRDLGTHAQGWLQASAAAQ